MFRSRFHPIAVGAWHARVTVFDGAGSSSGTPIPTCYLSTRFVVARSGPAVATTVRRTGPVDAVLPVVAGLPIVLGLVLLVMSGRRRARRRAHDPDPAGVVEAETPAERPGR